MISNRSGPLAVANTHALLWHLYDDPRLSAAVRRYFAQAADESRRIAVSTMSVVEIVYLVERRRVPSDALPRLAARLVAGDTVLVVEPISYHVAQAVQRISRVSVPDLPDRVIAATALYLQVPLLSRDRKIQLSNVPTVW